MGIKTLYKNLKNQKKTHHQGHGKNLQNPGKLRQEHPIYILTGEDIREYPVLPQNYVEVGKYRNTGIMLKID